MCEELLQSSWRRMVHNLSGKTDLSEYRDGQTYPSHFKVDLSISEFSWFLAHKSICFLMICILFILQFSILCFSNRKYVVSMYDLNQSTQLKHKNIETLFFKKFMRLLNQQSYKQQLNPGLGQAVGWLPWSDITRAVTLSKGCCDRYCYEDRSKLFTGDVFTR